MLHSLTRYKQNTAIINRLGHFAKDFFFIFEKGGGFLVCRQQAPKRQALLIRFVPIFCRSGGSKVSTPENILLIM
jgi:hypothetical protein